MITCYISEYMDAIGLSKLNSWHNVSAVNFIVTCVLIEAKFTESLFLPRLIYFI